MPNILHLKLCRKDFAAVASGQMKSEIKEYKPHWQSRLEGRDYEEIHIRNGYAPDSPLAVLDFGSCTLRGKGDKKEFVIEFGKLKKLEHWPV